MQTYNYLKSKLMLLFAFVAILGLPMAAHATDPTVGESITAALTTGSDLITAILTGIGVTILATFIVWRLGKRVSKAV